MIVLKIQQWLVCSNKIKTNNSKQNNFLDDSNKRQEATRLSPTPLFLPTSSALHRLNTLLIFVVLFACYWNITKNIPFVGELAHATIKTSSLHSSVIIIILFF